MANKLKMAKVDAILALWRRGWSKRRISRELGVDRGTVSKYVQEAEEGSKSADLPAGSEQNQPNPPTGSGRQNQPNPPTGSSGPQSLCEPFREFITESLDQGLSAQRIWQDLRADHGFTGSYDSIKRFARKLRSSKPFPFRRIERAPGEEAQVDFGAGGFVIDSEGRRRRPWVFRVVLSHSRKGYSEAMLCQSTEELIKERGVAGVRVLVGLTSLGNRYSWPEIDRACEVAWSHRSFNLRTIRELLKRKAPKQEEFEFMDRHPIIRSLSEYQQLVREAFREE